MIRDFFFSHAGKDLHLTYMLPYDSYAAREEEPSCSGLAYRRYSIVNPITFLATQQTSATTYSATAYLEIPND